MNNEQISFKSQYILENFTSIDPVFSYYVTHYDNNDVTRIVWVASYVQDNFEWFGIFISGNVIHSSIYDAKELCYIAPVFQKKIMTLTFL